MLKKLMRNSKAYYKINPTFNSCPSCKQAGTIVRSHSRNYKEKLISKFSFHKYYRCNKCGWRGLLASIKITSSSFLIILLYAVIIYGTSVITYQILKRLL